MLFMPYICIICRLTPANTQVWMSASCQTCLKEFHLSHPFPKEGRGWLVKIGLYIIRFIIDYGIILQTTHAPPLEKEGTMRFYLAICGHSFTQEVRPPPCKNVLNCFCVRIRSWEWPIWVKVRPCVEWSLLHTGQYHITRPYFTVMFSCRGKKSMRK